MQESANAGERYSSEKNTREKACRRERRDAGGTHARVKISMRGKYAREKVCKRERT